MRGTRTHRKAHTGLNPPLHAAFCDRRHDCIVTNMRIVVNTDFLRARQRIDVGVARSVTNSDGGGGDNPRPSEHGSAQGQFGAVGPRDRGNHAPKRGARMAFAIIGPHSAAHGRTGSGLTEGEQL
jgi:hypothetical protein